MTTENCCSIIYLSVMKMYLFTYLPLFSLKGTQSGFQHFLLLWFIITTAL